MKNGSLRSVYHGSRKNRNFRDEGSRVVNLSGNSHFLFTMNIKRAKRLFKKLDDQGPPKAFEAFLLKEEIKKAEKKKKQ
jgi:hypothetical protein